MWLNSSSDNSESKRNLYSKISTEHLLSILITHQKNPKDTWNSDWILDIRTTQEIEDIKMELRSSERIGKLIWRIHELESNIRNLRHNAENETKNLQSSIDEHREKILDNYNKWSEILIYKSEKRLEVIDQELEKNIKPLLDELGELNWLTDAITKFVSIFVVPSKINQIINNKSIESRVSIHNNIPETVSQVLDNTHDKFWQLELFKL